MPTFHLKYSYQIFHKSILWLMRHDMKTKTIHMWRRCITPQNFLLAFIDELWKIKKNQNFEKTKKTAGDFTHHFLVQIILHMMCTKNHNHMRYSFLRYRVRQLFFVILGHFLPFKPTSPSPLTTQKNKISKKWKKGLWRCHHFKLVQQKTQSNYVCLLRYGVQQT